MIKAYAAFEAKGALKPFEYDPGKLKPHEIEIDVHYCGICHSDLNVIDNDWGNTRYPVVPGHEVVGKISQLGSRVKNLSIGQVVGLGWHSGYCNECSLCRAGDHNMCSGSQATILGHHGGFADKVRAASNSVVPIPDGIDLESAGRYLRRHHRIQSVGAVQHQTHRQSGGDRHRRPGTHRGEISPCLGLRGHRIHFQ